MISRSLIAWTLTLIAVVCFGDGARADRPVHLRLRVSARTPQRKHAGRARRRLPQRRSPGRKGRGERSWGWTAAVDHGKATSWVTRCAGSAPPDPVSEGSALHAIRHGTMSEQTRIQRNVGMVLLLPHKPMQLA